ncbi:MAG: hypothetical protein ACC619_03555 [Paracoccaceae bacterium]
MSGNTLPYAPDDIAAFGGIPDATLTTVLLKKRPRNVWMRGAFSLAAGQQGTLGRPDHRRGCARAGRP